MIGLLVLVAVIWIVRLALAGGTSTGGDRPTPGDPSSPPPGSSPRSPTVSDPAERRRQDRADEAFVDGVLFAHHFDPFDPSGQDDDVTEDEAYWGDDDVYDDGWDDGMGDGGSDDGLDDAFHDDAGDW